jgi:hypothetical protein
MVHKPNIDKEKVNELKQRIQTIKHPVKEATKYPASLPMKELRKVLAQNRSNSTNQGEKTYLTVRSSNKKDALPPLRPFALNKNRSPEFKNINGKSCSPIKQNNSCDDSPVSV